MKRTKVDLNLIALFYKMIVMLLTIFLWDKYILKLKKIILNFIYQFFGRDDYISKDQIYHADFQDYVVTKNNKYISLRKQPMK